MPDESQEQKPDSALDQAFEQLNQARAEELTEQFSDAAPEPESKPHEDDKGPEQTDGSDAIDGAALDEALRLGLSEPEAREIARNPASLSVVRRLAARQADTAVRQPQEPKPEPEFKPFELQLSDDIDATLREKLVAMNNHYAGIAKQQHDQLRELRLHTGNMNQFVADARQQQQRVEFDALSASLPQEYHDLIGSRFGDPSASKEQAAARVELFNELMRMGGSYMVVTPDGQRQYQGPPLDQLIRRAANGLFHDKLQSRTRASVANEIQDRRRQSIARPGQRRNGTLTSDERDRKIDEMLNESRR